MVIELLANIEQPADAAAAVQAGAEGAGLFRSEFLFMDALASCRMKRSSTRLTGRRLRGCRPALNDSLYRHWGR